MAGDAGTKSGGGGGYDEEGLGEPTPFMGEDDPFLSRYVFVRVCLCVSASLSLYLCMYISYTFSTNIIPSHLGV
jgi:hypothetical protein